MISPNVEQHEAGGGCGGPMARAVQALTGQAGPTPEQAERAFVLWGAASAAIIIFSDAPSVENAQEARRALAAWAGPMARRCVEDIARHLSPLARTQLLQAALTLYIAEQAKTQPGDVL